MPDRTWTEIGEQLFDVDRATREGHNYCAGRDVVAAAIDGLDWVELPADGSLTLPFSPGEAIKTLIRELDLRGVRRIAWNGALPVRDDVEHSRGLYGLYGIEVPERGGLLRLFAVDRGTDLLPVAVDRIPAEAVA